MFSEYTETSVNPVSTRSTSKVPTIATTLTTSGMSAATRPPKTSTSRTKVTGKAINSALVRSCCTRSETAA